VWFRFSDSTAPPVDFTRSVPRGTVFRAFAVSKRYRRGEATKSMDDRQYAKWWGAGFKTIGRIGSPVKIDSLSVCMAAPPRGGRFWERPEHRRVYELAVELALLLVCIAAPPRGGGHFLCCCKESNQRKQLSGPRCNEAATRDTPRMEQRLSV